ncbi:MAG: 3-oxoacid CoA-transferase, partial [Clostridia bacterium]|nr:3-oxoacid CoA-transferase [Clostridia bacterium]
MQGYAAQNRLELCGALRRPTGSLPALPLDNRKLIARRGAMELKQGCLINLGIGIPSGVGAVANEEGFADQVTLSLESGPQGGVPVEGAGFAASVDPECIYTVADMLDLYDGGVLDMSFLGAAEVDERGNVNVSKFGTRCTGPGGFVNISQNTKKVYFVGTFTAGGLEEEVRDGKLVIVKEGRCKKFLRSVQQITFSGSYAVRSGQDVTFITERAVLKLTNDGLVLTEIAPGVDLVRDVLDQMEFKPILSPELRTMDARIFNPGTMGLTL